MDVTTPLTMLGGQSPAQFMRRHWHKKPLLVRQAFPGLQPPVSRAELFEQASMEEVESRLVVRAHDTWRLRHGPFSRRSFPPLSRPGWTLLVQGLDLHVPAAHDLLRRFRFVPDARLDDVPLKILQHFQPEQEWVLEPGDMLYLPPRWGHDGVAVGWDCMTCSVGFRSSSVAELAGELLARAADVADLEDGPPRSRVRRRYRDPGQAATQTPGQVPAALQHFAQEAVQAVLAQPGRLQAVLGEWLTEPKPQVWFQPGTTLEAGHGVRLDQRTRMMYDDRHVFLNGESFRASGPDARWMRQLADHRALGPREVAALSAQARAMLEDAVQAGWMHGHPPLRGAP